MSLFQLSRPWIEILPFVIFHDYAKGNVTGMVVDTSSTAGEDIVFVEGGDGSSVVGEDCYAGWGDGSSFGPWHCIVLIYLCLWNSP